MRRIHYSWIIAAVGLVTLITSAGFRSTTGILIVPLHMAGAAVAAWRAGAVCTWFGGYGRAFGTSGLLCLFAVGLVTQIARGPEVGLMPVPA